MRHQRQEVTACPFDDGVHDQIACLHPACAGLHDHIAAGQRRQQGGDIEHRGGIVEDGRERAAAGDIVIGRVGDGDVGGVEQQGATLAMRRAEVHRAAEIKRALARNLDEAAAAALRATFGRGMAEITHSLLGPQDDAAARTFMFRVRRKRRTGFHQRVGGPGRGAAALIIAAHADLAAAHPAGSRNIRRYGEGDRVAEQVDLPAFGAAMRAFGLHIARHGKRAFARIERDRAALAAHAVGADAAALDQQCIDRLPRLRHGQLHRAAIGRDLAGIGHGLAEHRVADLQFDQPVAGHIDRMDVARGKLHFAQLCSDNPMIFNMRRDQPDKARLPRSERAMVDDAGIRRAGGGEGHRPACHEFLVVHVAGGGDDGGRVNAGAAAEDHAVGVHEDDLTVGLDLPVDLRGLVVADAVERDGAG